MPAAVGPANIVIGGHERTAALAVFAALRPGRLTAAQTYWVGTEFGAGYASGSGGLVVAELVQVGDDGQPTGPVLASTMVPAPSVSAPNASNGDGTDAIGATARGFKRLVFDTPASVRAGVRYGLLFRNTDADAAHKYSSLNATWQHEGKVASMPWQADVRDWQVLQRTGSDARFVPAYASVGHAEPILAVEIDGVWHGRHLLVDGAQGAGAPGGLWYEGWQAQNPKRADAVGATVRQTALPLTAGEVDALAVSARVRAGAGDVVLALVTDDGATALRALASQAAATPGFVTITATLPAPVALPAGRYSLLVSTTGSLVLDVGAVGDGEAAGYTRIGGATLPGWAEWSSDAGASWTPFDRYGGVEPDHASDVPFGVRYR